MAKGASFTLDISSMEKLLDSAPARADMAIRGYARNVATKLKHDAQQDAKWTDRTGDARRRLDSYETKVSNGYKIALAQGVPYGIYLEYAMEKRYAIIEPTLQKVSPEALKGLQGLLDRL